MDQRRDYARTRRNRHAHEIFLAGASGIGRLRVGLNVEARQACRSGHQKYKRGNRPQLDDLAAEVGIVHDRERAKSPEPCQDCRRNSEGNYIGQRIKLTAKRADRIGESRDAAIESIEQNGKADCLGRMVEMPGIAGRPQNSLRNRVIAGSNVDRRKQGRKDVQPLVLWSLTGRFVLRFRRMVAHRASATSRELDTTPRDWATASTDDPPAT